MEIFSNVFSNVRGMWSEFTDDVEGFFESIYDPVDSEDSEEIQVARVLSPSEEELLLERWKNEREEDDSPLAGLFEDAASSVSGRERQPVTSQSKMQLDPVQKGKGPSISSKGTIRGPESVDPQLLLRRWIERLSEMDRIVATTKAGK